MSRGSPTFALLEDRAGAFSAKPALIARRDGRWAAMSYAQLFERSNAVAARLVADGAKPADRLALLSESCPEFAVTLLGAWRAGLVVVPLDPKLTLAELRTILLDCSPRILAVSAKQVAQAMKLRDADPATDGWRAEHLLCIQDADCGVDPIQVGSLSAPPPVAERGEQEMALLIYTSGTTGAPKGVMISEGNLVFETSLLADRFGVTAADRLVSVLPLNHLLELTGGLLAVLHAGATVSYSAGLSPQDLSQALREQHATAMIGVPLLFRMMKEGIEKQLRAAGGVKRAFIERLFAIAPSVPSAALRRALFRPLHAKLGGSLRVFVSGGAPLDPEVRTFFDRIGIPTLEGYGLTETSPVVSVNTLRERRPGSVGRPVPGVEIRIAAADAEDSGTRADAGGLAVGEEGEVLVRGPNVMLGYYKRDDATREAIDGRGYFHTGDLGRVDDAGYLYITGRLKNLIVLGGGKKVHPEEVEAVLSKSTLVREVCVLGQESKGKIRSGTEEVWAVVVPAEALLPEFAEDPKAVQARIEQELTTLARELAVHKRPAHFAVRAEELPKTPTRKVKRKLVQAWLADSARSG